MKGKRVNNLYRLCFQDCPFEVITRSLMASEIPGGSETCPSYDLSIALTWTEGEWIFLLRITR